MTTAPHPDYPQDRGNPQGDRCVCGGIRYWHAVAPHGCDDCGCTQFIKACDHAWHWTGERFACAICSGPTSERQALADMGEPA